MKKFKLYDTYTVNMTRMYVKAKDHFEFNDQKVYFYKTCSIPRKKFKEDYPNCIIVSDPEEADVLVVNQERFDNLAGRYYRLKSTGVVIDEATMNIVNTQLLKDYICKTDKPVVCQDAIKLKGSGKILTDEVYEYICKCMKGDSEMVNLGLVTLMSYDYLTNRDRYALALLRVKNKYFIPKTRAYQTIKRNLKKEYVNLVI